MGTITMPSNSEIAVRRAGNLRIVSAGRSVWRGVRLRPKGTVSPASRICRTVGGAVSAPFILASGEKHPDAPPLERPFFRFGSGQTDGLLALAEVQLPPLTAGPNLHVHANEDEMFFVLDGVMTVQVGD